MLKHLSICSLLLLLLTGCNQNDEDQVSWWCDFYNNCPKEDDNLCAFYGNCPKEDSASCSFYGNCPDSAGSSRTRSGSDSGGSHVGGSMEDQ